jgi:hypothetical protein
MTDWALSQTRRADAENRWATNRSPLGDQAGGISQNDFWALSAVEHFLEVSNFVGDLFVVSTEG